jgi:hypothetical protein
MCRVNIQMETSDWPPSNYPIFLALVLLVATAVTLSMGDETRAENLAIYAYYLLVIGVTIRFLELSIPYNTLKKAQAAMVRISATIQELSERGSRYAKNVLIFQKIREFIPSVEHKPISMPSIGKVINQSNLVLMKNISKEVSIYLGVLLAVMYVYGSIFEWWIVWGYMEKLVLVVIGFSSTYLLLRILLRHSYEV